LEEDDEMEAGRGYWIYLDSPTTYTITGQILDHYTLELNSGWSMIGGCSFSARASVNKGSIKAIYAFDVLVLF
jgi:hypothetical protein